jgi:hypothetical protein
MASTFHTKELYCAEVNTESYHLSRRKLEITLVLSYFNIICTSLVLYIVALCLGQADFELWCCDAA